MLDELRAVKWIGMLGKSVYFGIKSPVNYDLRLDVVSASDYKCDSSLYDSFDSSVFLDEPITYYNTWKNILDEMVRMVKDGGYLLVKYVSTSFGKEQELEHFISNLPFNRVSLEEKITLKAYGVKLAMFRVKKEKRVAYADNKFSIFPDVSGHNIIVLPEKYALVDNFAIRDAYFDILLLSAKDTRGRVVIDISNPAFIIKKPIFELYKTVKIGDLSGLAYRFNPISQVSYDGVFRCESFGVQKLSTLQINILKFKSK